MIEPIPMPYVEWHPSTQEQRSAYRTNDKNIDVLGQEEQCKLHPRIFCMETRCKFRFCFCEIEWRPVGFSGNCNDENYKSDDGRDMAFEQPPSILLRSNDI